MTTILEPLRNDSDGMSYYQLKRWLLANGEGIIHYASQDTPIGDLAMAVMEAAAKDLTAHTLDTERALRGAIAMYLEAEK